MKILHLTDVETTKPIIEREILEEIKFVLLTGDLTRGTRNFKKNVQYFSKIADAIPDGIPIYYIPGNRELESMIDRFEGMPASFIPIHNRYIKYKFNDSMNIYIIGFGSALPGFMNNFVQTEGQFKDALEHMFMEVNQVKNPQDMVILMVHNPPFKSKLDFALTIHDHIGSKSVREAIEVFKPELCVCGHVHESQGIETIGSTICVNPGAGRFGNASLIEIDDSGKKDKINVTIIKIIAEK